MKTTLTSQKTIGEQLPQEYRSVEMPSFDTSFSLSSSLHLITAKAFGVRLFAKRAPEFVGFIPIVAEAESLLRCIVRQPVVHDHLFPFAEAPKVELEETRVIYRVERLIRRNHVLQ